MKKRSYLAYIINNKVLLVRESKDRSFKLPGGRSEKNETAAECLLREISEELSATVAPESLVLIGNYSYSYSGSNDCDTYIFGGKLNDEPQVDGEEIAEYSWYNLGSKLPLSSQMETHVLPLLINGGYLNEQR